MPSHSRLHRFKRRIDAARGGERDCDLCRRPLILTDLGAQAMDWLDPAHMERPALFLVLCGRCCAGDFADECNELHRRRWASRHSTPVVENWLLVR